MLTWRAGAAGADVARGTTLKVRRGTEATWQSPGGPRGAQEAHSGAATWQGAMRPRGSMWAPVWGATWQVVWQMEGPRVSGPWLVIWGGNANALPRPPI